VDHRAVAGDEESGRADDVIEADRAAVEALRADPCEVVGRVADDCPEGFGVQGASDDRVDADAVCSQFSGQVADEDSPRAFGTPAGPYPGRPIWLPRLDS
jgi:hypothetical protein